jgi:branched-chain amino acid transport system substrate-binding protein
MARWTRFIGAAAVVTMVAAALAGCTGGGTGTGPNVSGPAKGEPIKIGAVLSLTGAQAGLGVPEENALKMDVKRINDEGGVNGHPIEVLIEDDASDVDQAVSATTKLIERDKVVAIIGSTGSGQSMAMRGDIDKAGIPQVSLGSSTDITGQFDKWVFQTPWTAKLIVPLTLDYIKGAGFTKVGLISEDTGFGKDGRKLVKEMAASKGLTVVGDEVFKGTDTDMTAQLTVLKSAGAEVVLMWSSVAASAIVPKNMAQLNWKAPLVGCHGIARQEFIDGAGASAEGVTAFAGKVLAPETYGVGSEGYKTATGFVERYTKAYGKAPDHFAGHAYDALYLIVEAARILPAGFGPEELRGEIEQTKDFPGIGGTFTFSATDHNGMTASDIVRYKVENGKWVLAK